MKKELKPTVTFKYPNTHEHQYEIECVRKALDLNSSVFDALNKIRTRLKYESPTKKEIAVLEELRSILSEFHVEG